MLNIVASYHCIQFQRKLMNQTWKNGQKHSARPDFHSFWPKFGPIFFLGFTSTRCYALLQAIIVHNSKENQWTKQWQKNWFQPRFQFTKKEKNNPIQNYCPVSLLPIFGKNFEQLTLNSPLNTLMKMNCLILISLVFVYLILV